MLATKEKFQHQNRTLKIGVYTVEDTRPAPRHALFWGLFCGRLSHQSGFFLLKGAFSKDKIQCLLLNLKCPIKTKNEGKKSAFKHSMTFDATITQGSTT